MDGREGGGAAEKLVCLPVSLMVLQLLASYSFSLLFLFLSVSHSHHLSVSLPLAPSPWVFACWSSENGVRSGTCSAEARGRR